MVKVACAASGAPFAVKLRGPQTALKEGGTKVGSEELEFTMASTDARQARQPAP
jgi:hypothetical protein